MAVIRFPRKFKIGDVGVCYEFNVKLRGTRTPYVNSSLQDSEFNYEVEGQIDDLYDELKEKYPWVGEIRLTGRSNGWLSIEDRDGKATEQDLEDIDARVTLRKREFVKYLETQWPRDD